MQNAWKKTVMPQESTSAAATEFTTGRSLLVFEPGTPRKAFDDLLRFLASNVPPAGSLFEAHTDLALVSTEPQYWEMVSVGVVALPPSVLSLQMLRGFGVRKIEAERTTRMKMNRSRIEVADPAWGVPRVLGSSSATGINVRCAILDTGIDLQNHPAFPTSRIKATGFVVGSDPQDRIGHGTHVAGIACGSVPASGARFSIAHEADILSCKVVSDAGDVLQAHVIAGIEWAMKQRADVALMAFGWPVNVGSRYDDSIEQAAAAAQAAGVCLIAAAGNDAEQTIVGAVNGPANCPSIVAVAAVDEHLRVTPFSCGQRNPDGEVNVAAPGDGILSAALGGTSAVFSGTSQAAAFAAGVAALWKERKGATGAALKELLLSNTSPLQDDVKAIGRGLVQAPA